MSNGARGHCHGRTTGQKTTAGERGGHLQYWVAWASPPGLAREYPGMETRISVLRLGRPVVHLEFDIVEIIVSTSTRPRPVDRPLHQSASHGVKMNVLDHLPGSCRLGDIPVVSATLSPKTVLDSSRRPSDFQSLQPLGSIRTQEVYGPSRNRLLDGLQYVFDTASVRCRIDHQVSVLGHNHVGPNLEVPLFAGLLNRVDEPLSRTISIQHGQAMCIRECQLVGLSGNVESLKPLARPRGPVSFMHARQPSQWRTGKP